MPKSNETAAHKSAKSLNTAHYNLDAEQSVLCCALLDDRTVQDVVLDLSEEDFYSPANKTIFCAMHDIVKSNKALDLVMLTDNLERNGQLNAVGGIEYLTTIATYLPSAANYKNYLDIVTRESAKRKLARGCTDILAGLKQAEDKQTMLAEAEKIIFDISDTNKTSGLTHIKGSVHDVLQRCDEMYKNKNAYRGLMTGFVQLDKLTNGLQAGTLNILAARPGCGKSSLALNIIEYAAKKGKVSALFSLEMPASQLVQRLMCGISGVSMKKVTGTEKLILSDFQKLLTAAEAMEKYKIFIDDSSLNTPAKMLSKLRALKMREGLDLVVVDYIQLMSGDSNGRREENRQQEVSNITKNLKIMSKELNVPIIALSQLNRLVERDKDRKPQLSDLRESGAIEQDADIVMFISKSNEATDDYAVPVQLIVAKNRQGETGEIPLVWVGDLVHFVDDKKIFFKSQQAAAATDTDTGAEADQNDDFTRASADDLPWDLETPPPDAEEYDAPPPDQADHLSPPPLDGNA